MNCQYWQCRGLAVAIALVRVGASEVIIKSDRLSLCASSGAARPALVGGLRGYRECYISRMSGFQGLVVAL
ncbi:MAG: hypothetical protein F6K00_35285 [Leptolyngbya sp. SIOISBB]|nr:hypothetical protein [Leptolyngbya sp. SIOISBB]